MKEATVEYSILAIDTEQTGQRIAMAMKEQDVTVRQLQTLFGFDAPNAIYHWLQGSALPTVDHLVILAHTLNVRVDDLLAVREKTSAN